MSRRWKTIALLASIATAAGPVLGSPAALAQGPLRTEGQQTIQDAVGDVQFPQGDLVTASASADSSGMVTVSATVQVYESLMSHNWQYGDSALYWDFDLNGDEDYDLYAGVVNYNGQILAGVLNTNDEPVCQGTFATDATAKSYSVTFPAQCLGNPPSFRWAATLQYDNPDLAAQSVDTMPEQTWAGPVANDAYVPCAPGTVAPSDPPLDGFAPLVPARLLDTRFGQTTIDCQFNGIGAVGGTKQVQLDVRGRGGVPTNATAVVLNLTATESAAAGFVTVYPCGTAVPMTSNLNYVAGQTVANAVIASIADDGRVCLFSNVDVHLIADVTGYFTNASSFTAAAPGRSYDSRNISPTRLPAGAVVPVGSQGTGATVMNVTVTDPATAGYATVFPCGGERPVASNVNFAAGATAANLVVGKPGDNGSICVYLSAAAHLVIDTFGSFDATGSFQTVVPARLLETRSGLSTADGVSNGIGMLAGPVVTHLQVTGRGNVPTGATTAVLNVTVDGPTAAGFITVFPCDSAQPLASNLNFVPGLTVPNAVITKLAADGTVCLYTNAPTHLIVDVNGYFGPIG
jgi:hypothetical protein